MVWLAALGGGAFVLASLVVSLRLIYLAKRTRELPELLIGVGLLLMGGIGYPLSTVARLAGGDVSLQSTLFIVHALLTLVGQSAVVLFNWRVFRRSEHWARALAFLFLGTLVTLFLWQSVTPGWQRYATGMEGPWSALPFYSLFVLGWAGLESLLYHRKLRRRLSLGLADAVTTDRLRLWAIAMLAAFSISLISLTLRQLGFAMTPTLSAIVVGPLGLVSATAMWLAFLPPDRYLSWISLRTS